MMQIFLGVRGLSLWLVLPYPSGLVAMTRSDIKKPTALIRERPAFVQASPKT